MTNKELIEKIARLETELAEVKEKIAALPKRVDGGVFKPEDGQEYWFITHSGILTNDQWDDHWADHGRYEIGNCFPTEQAAEDAVRVLKLIQKARESQDGFIVDWENWMQNKYVLYFNKEEKELRITNYFLIDQAPIFGFWGDESACEQFINENHDELTWFFTEYRR
mgnify:CR=1 FL=1